MVFRQRQGGRQQGRCDAAPRRSHNDLLPPLPRVQKPRSITSHTEGTHLEGRRSPWCPESWELVAKPGSNAGAAGRPPAERWTLRRPPLTDRGSWRWIGRPLSNHAVPCSPEGGPGASCTGIAGSMSAVRMLSPAPPRPESQSAPGAGYSRVHYVLRGSGRGSELRFRPAGVHFEHSNE